MEERARRSIRALPGSAEEAFAALAADADVRGFLPAPLLAIYVANHEAEAALGRDWSVEDLCRRYAEVY